MTHKERTANNLRGALLFLSLYPDAKLFPAYARKEGDGYTHQPLVAWRSEASSDPDTLQYWAWELVSHSIDRETGKTRRLRNNGSRTVYFCIAADQSGVQIVDADDKHGKNGNDTITALALDGKHLPETLRSRTPSGRGGHWFYLGPPVRHVAGSMGEGLDTPVMAPLPGQDAHPKGRYEEVTDELGMPYLMVQAPEWIRYLAGAPKPKHADVLENYAGELDADRYVEEMTEYLERTAPDVTERNVAAHRAAAMMRDYAISEEKSAELLREVWRPLLPDPDFEDSEIEKCVRSAWATAQNPIGCKTVEGAEAAFGAALTGEAQPSPTDKNGRIELRNVIFPDMTRADNPRPMASIDNVRMIMAAYGITARYNAMSFRREYYHPYGGSAAVMGDDAITLVQDLALRHGMVNGRNLAPLMQRIASENEYHPIKAWLEQDGGCWDGVPRLQKLIATVTPRDEYPLALRDVLIARWLCSAVAALYAPNFSTRGTLTFLGGQSMGKTSWCRALCPPGAFLEGASLDPGNKDSKLAALSHWIVELGEVGSTLKKDIDGLKAFLTSARYTIRKPYDREETVMQRQTVFTATVNDDLFLKDSTGNARWWTIPCAEIDYCHGLDMRQVWLEVKETLYEKGYAWHLTPEEQRMLDAVNAEHVIPDEIADAINDAFDFSTPPGEFMTTTEVLELTGIRNPNTMQLRKAGVFLTQMLGRRKSNNGRKGYRMPALRDRSTREAERLFGESSAPGSALN